MKTRTLLVASVLAALAGCNHSSSSDSSSNPPPTFSFDYTLFSNANNMPVGSKAIYVWASANSSCGSSGQFAHDFAGTVTTANQIHVQYTHQRTFAYVESIYLDIDASGTLTPGDKVWGTSSTNLAGVCDPAGMAKGNTTTNYNWEDLADSFGGYTTYTGAPQSFAAPMPGSITPLEAESARF